MRDKRPRWFLHGIGAALLTVLLMITLLALAANTPPAAQVQTTASNLPDDIWPPPTNIRAIATATEQANINTTATAVNLACDPAAVFATQTAVAQTGTPPTLLQVASPTHQFIQSTPAPLAQTATAVRTNALGTATSTPLLATPDALMQTATAVRYLAETEAARRSDALLLTATAVRLYATQTAAVTTPTATVDPLMQTATAVRLYATQTGAVNLTATPLFLTPGATPTPLPPLTAGTLDALRQTWITQLETAVGFSHPILETFGDDLVRDACAALAVRPPHIIWTFSTNPRVESFTANGTTFVALIADSGFQWIQQRLLLFRVTADQIALLLDSANSSAFDLWITFDNMSYPHDWLGGFADRNGNGHPEIAVDTGSGGSSVWHWLVILEIDPDGRVANIAPLSVDPFYARRFVDLEPDRILEIEVEGCISHPQSDCWANGVNIFRYYAWDGAAYTDMSNTLDESYYPEIASFFREAIHLTGCFPPNAHVYRALLAYYALGRLEAGWARVQPFLRWELCTTEQIQQFGTDMIALESWVERLLG